MSGLDSWEDDPAAQDDNLSKQTQQSLNLNGQSHNFQPGATSFQPGAQTFQPGQPFGGYNQQYGQYGQYGQSYQPQYQNNYPQYQQQGYNQGYGQQNAYDQDYGRQYQNYNQQQTYQPPHQRQQQQATPVIAKRPQEGQASTIPTQSVQTTHPTPTTSQSQAAAQPKAKVLSIGGDTSTPPKAKVLSIGSTAPLASKKDTGTADDGAKVAAAKAIEKSGPTATSADKTGSAPLSGNANPSPAELRAAREADAVAKEQAEDVADEILEEVYGKEHVNVIFIGHVDAGKSTLGGSILYASGMVDERTMEKYKRDAKEAGRETWYLSWALDLTKEERAKGKTVEVGRGFFETEKRRYSIVSLWSPH